MRRFWYLAGLLALTPLASYRATAADEPPKPTTEAKTEQFTVKVSIKNLDPYDTIRLLLAAPAPVSAGPKSPQPVSAVPNGITAILSYPLDHSLLVRGDAASVQLLKNALGVIDVPVDKLPGIASRVTLQPRAFRPEQFRALLPEEVGYGKITASEKELTLEGTKEWLHKALGLVARLEVAPPAAPK